MKHKEKKAYQARDLFTHGFIDAEVSEILDISLEHAKALYQAYFETPRLEYLKKIYRARKYNKLGVTIKTMPVSQFSIDEMDYGTVIREYDTETMKGQERYIFNKISKQGIKKEFKLDYNENKRTSKVPKKKQGTKTEGGSKAIGNIVRHVHEVRIGSKEPILHEARKRAGGTRWNTMRSAI